MSSPHAPVQGVALLITARSRAWLYALALTVVATAILFNNLGGSRIEGDEAHYALCTDTIRHTGQWLTLRPHPPKPYLNKPPLYMWLTAATYDLVPGFAEKYRFWSAAFGVGCVALTCVLGCLLFTPEVGALAGALLLTNRQFLLEHGARAGDMDSGLTFLMAASLVLLRLILLGRAAWWGWAGIGIAAGLASLFKPFFGLPILATVFILAIALGRGVRWRSRIEGMLLATILSVVVAGPWYGIQWSRFKGEFVDAILHQQVVNRITTGLNAGETKGATFYLWGEPGAREKSITFSSPPFLAALPALLFAAIAAIRSAGRRRAFGLVALTGIGWVAALSASRGKFLHYAYPIFPVLCVGIASAGAWATHRAAAQLRSERSRQRFLAFASIATVIAFVVAFGRFGFHLMPEQQKRYVPWELYRSFRPAIEAGSARLVFFGLPGSPGEWEEVEPAMQSADVFYFWHMRGGIRASTSDELGLLLETRRPTLALLSKRRDWTDVHARGRLGERIEERFTFDHRVFTAAAIDVDGLLRPRLTPGAENPCLELLDVDPPQAATPHADAAAAPPAGWGFKNGFTVRVRPPLPQEVRLNVMVRRAGDTQSKRVRLAISGARGPGGSAVPLAFEQGQRLTATLDRDRRDPMAARDVTFTLSPADEPRVAEDIRGVITDVWLDVLLRTPGEEAGRK